MHADGSLQHLRPAAILRHPLSAGGRFWGTAMVRRAASDTVQLKVRMKERLRSLLEAQAAEHGDSMNTEIVARLERSLWDDEKWYENYGGKDIWALMMLIAQAAVTILGPGGRGFANDLERSIQLRAAVAMILDEIAPEGTPKIAVRELRDMGEDAAFAVLLGATAYNYMADPDSKETQQDGPKTALTGVLRGEHQERREQVRANRERYESERGKQRGDFVRRAQRLARRR